MSLASSMLGDLTEGFSLPITRRGLFSKDDFFQRFQNDYSNAVEDVLDRWGSRSSQADRFASYRRLRERDSSDDNIAASISDTGENYVIVIDMSEFASGNITVQTVQCSVVVEGQCGARCYKRQFPLPRNIDTERLSADVSDENILTVTAPKKGSKVIAISTDSNTTATKPASGVSSLEAEIIPAESRANLAATSGPSTMSSAAQAIKSEVSAERRSSQSRIIPLNVEGESSSQAQTSKTTSSSEIVSERIIPTKVGEQMAIHTTSSYQNRVLPLTRRGRFFQDRAFENVWKDFECAIDELVERRGSSAGMEKDKDRFQSYRNLRKVVQQDDNQAATVAKEANECKIVVDVKDFVDGHLDVKAVKGAVIVIGKKGPYSFERRFSVAGLSQPDKVSAAISTDGVLTITAPL